MREAVSRLAILPEASPSVSPRLAICAVVAIAIVSWSVIGWQVLAGIKFLTHATRVDGMVVDARPHPTIRFTGARGEVIEFSQNGGLSAPPGTAVPVAFNAASPASTARVALFWPLWSETVMLLPIALLFGGVLIAMTVALIPP